MSATATALVSERRRYKVDWRLVLALAIQLVLMVFSYGRLTQRVDDLHDQIQLMNQDVHEIRQDVRDLRSDLKK